MHTTLSRVRLTVLILFLKNENNTKTNENTHLKATYLQTSSIRAYLSPTAPIPPRLVPLALHIARPVYLNEVDKDVQSGIVCSLCSSPEGTQITGLSVLADVTYIL